MGAYHSVSPGWATTDAGWTGSFGPMGTYGNQAYNLRSGRHGTNQQFAMAPSTAWDEDAIPQQCFGAGYNQPANLYGGDFGFAFGRDAA
ncbi:hypothetical protein AC579_1379 [Pseudocercospora musae]|uniref:Uncharacterized protein n=1 Tax=Pseudocercospora musae TaxID=113226 RepID=A0A139IKC4_9PEZI|nr:hypothetical protein AC579_1379 [Pseudocercospora musae]